MKEINEIHFDSIDSTSSFLKRNSSVLPDMTFVTSDSQTSGHGRMGRVWFDGNKKDLLFSFLIKDKEVIEHFPSLSLLCAVSVLKCLREMNVIGVSIKWPNDVYVFGKKICGILLEGISDQDGISSITVGIGLNVGSTSFPDGLNATSLDLECGVKNDITGIKSRLFSIIMTDIEALKNGDRTYLDVIRQNNYLKDRLVTVTINGERRTAAVTGIDNGNRLTVMADGKEFSVFTDEANLKIES